MKKLIFIFFILYSELSFAGLLRGVFADVELSNSEGITTVFIKNKEAFPLDCRLGINGFQWKVEIQSNNKSEVFFYDPKKYTYDMVRFRCVKSKKTNLNKTLRYRI